MVSTACGFSKPACLSAIRPPGNTTSAAIADRYALVSSVSSLDGRYNCSLSVYDTESSSEKPIESYLTENELPVKLHMNSNSLDSFAVTDSSLIFLDKKFEANDIIKFNQSKTENFYIENNHLAITERNNLVGNSMKLTVFSFDGTKLNSFNIPDEIYDVCIGKTYIYALGKNNVYKYSISAEDSTSLASPVDFKYNSIVCDTDDNCYLLSNTLFSRVNFE